MVFNVLASFEILLMIYATFNIIDFNAETYEKGFVVDYDNQIMFTILVLSVKWNRVHISLG